MHDTLFISQEYAYTLEDFNLADRQEFRYLYSTLSTLRGHGRSYIEATGGNCLVLIFYVDLL